jgi:2-oxo-4-hydroxy-4-carboxy-5-ureidoimidazoline decarboxylase
MVRVATLGSFNAATEQAATRDALACCESSRFAKMITAGRPYRDMTELRSAIDAAFVAMTWEDVTEAMNAHPRIGAPADTTSAAEQTGAAAAGGDVRAALAAGNAAYEHRFGHVFLICASGLSGAEMLAQLRARLEHSPAAERSVAKGELSKITRLRMARLLGLGDYSL